MATATIEEKKATPLAGPQTVENQAVDETLEMDTSETPSQGVAVSGEKSEQAAVEASEQDAAEGTVSSAEQEIISTAPPAEVQHEGENQPVELHPAVTKAGVKTVQPDAEIPDGMHAAEVTPTKDLGNKDVIKYDTGPIFPSGEGLANEDTNGPRLVTIVQRRLYQLFRRRHPEKKAA